MRTDSCTHVASMVHISHAEDALFSITAGLEPIDTRVSWLRPTVHHHEIIWLVNALTDTLAAGIVPVIDHVRSDTACIVNVRVESPSVSIQLKIPRSPVSA
jgi:hypothetical protein